MLDNSTDYSMKYFNGTLSEIHGMIGLGFEPDFKDPDKAVGFLARAY